MMPERIETSVRALSIQCNAHAKAELEKLLGPATVAVENDGVEPRRYLYYRLKTPAENKEEFRKLELARELAAGITNGVFNGSPPAHLNPKICRIVNRNPTAEINLDTALEILRKAAGGEAAAPKGEPPLTIARDGQNSCRVVAPPETSDQNNTTTKIIQLAELAQEVIEITELEPANGVFIGKRVNCDGSLTEYPKIFWWRQSVARVPATIPQLFAHLRAGAQPQHLPDPRRSCQSRTAADTAAEGRHGRRSRIVATMGLSTSPPGCSFSIVDGMPLSWRANPERAIQTMVAQLGEPWASTSFVWFFSAKHGLEFDEHKRWTGKIIDGKLYARIVFHH